MSITLISLAQRSKRARRDKRARDRAAPPTSYSAIRVAWHQPVYGGPFVLEVSVSSASYGMRGHQRLAPAGRDLQTNIREVRQGRHRHVRPVRGAIKRNVRTVGRRICQITFERVEHLFPQPFSSISGAAISVSRHPVGHLFERDVVSRQPLARDRAAIGIDDPFAREIGIGRPQRGQRFGGQDIFPARAPACWHPRATTADRRRDFLKRAEERISIPALFSGIGWPVSAKKNVGSEIGKCHGRTDAPVGIEQRLTQRTISESDVPFLKTVRSTPQ